MARRTETFSAISTEGGLLPADLLQALLSPKGDIGGSDPQSYHLAAGEKIGDQVNRSWNRLQGCWQNYRKATAEKSEGQPTTTETRERWLYPLFQELGFGRLAAGRPIQIDGREYPISHAWESVPVHLVGSHVDLDRRTPGAVGAARMSPHSMLQQTLNNSDGMLWGLVSNGLTLRLLRDNVALSRQALVEFDMETILEGDLYGEFLLLWMVCHQSRFEGERPESCWLEKWKKIAEDTGLRALENLRPGVEAAITALGSGFVAHRANAELRQKLASGTLSTHDLYQQVLRVVYRMLFLFVAEDRGLLHPEDDTEAARKARKRYSDFYSLGRLRSVRLNRAGTPHPDLWNAFRLVSQKLGSAVGCPELALPPLGSFLWSGDATPDLDSCHIANRHFLEAVHALAFVRDENVRRSVDYRNLGAEELGSVYEGLLELHPLVNTGEGKFELNVAAGNERKTTGSYYTPDSLVQCLLESALEPVMAEAVKGKSGEDAAKAILDLKVCDPAVGSGHFLIAAAHRMAKRIAALRSGEDEPSPTAVRSALRQVVGRCLYGVDINPMAAELCKVSLWLEALEPGKPLSFLDHHIRVGNSLLGATPELIAKGIPDDAFKPIEGDDKKACSELKKINARGRRGLGELFAQEDLRIQEDIRLAAQAVDAMPDDTPVAIASKTKAFQTAESNYPAQRAKAIADAWCSAFVVRKYIPEGEQQPFGITQRHIQEAARLGLPDRVRENVSALAVQYQFFHWHLACPEVFARGGFDCVLANPPWERVKLQEKEWFAERSPEIATAPTAAARKRLIDALKANDTALYQQFLDESRRAEGESHIMRNTGCYPLCARGDINLYAVFAEGMRSLLGERGRVGSVLPTGIATDDTTKFFFQDVVETRALVSLFDFENKGTFFPGVHSSYKFCLFTAGRGIRPMAPRAEFVFFAHVLDDLNDPQRRFTLSTEDIGLLNPNTRTSPIFRSRGDAELTKAIYRRVPVLIRGAQRGCPEENPWSIRFVRMFDMSNDSGLFRTRQQLEADGWRLEGNVFRRDGNKCLPLYEAKMIHHFDHRWATYDGPDTCDMTLTEEQNPERVACGRYWLDAREVYLRLAVLPPGLLDALRNRNDEIIILALAHLLFACFLSSRFEGSSSAAMQGLYQAWLDFVERHPFARGIAPTAMGLCDDDPCISARGPSYLPAEPIDDVTAGPRVNTAWYAAIPDSVESFLGLAMRYGSFLAAEFRIANEAEGLEYAEALLEKTSPSWLMGCRDICRSTDERTVIGGVFPLAAVGNNLPIWAGSSCHTEALAALLSSFACDFSARFKVGGTHLNFFIAEQIPVLLPDVLQQGCAWCAAVPTNFDWLLRRILELTFTAHDLKPFAQDCDWTGPPFRWDDERRFLLRCELDAAFFHLYLPADASGQWKPARVSDGAVRDETPEELAELKKLFPIPRDAVAYIMDTFPIVRRKDEEMHGSYRTKDTILSIYDAMQDAIRTGQPYQTRLDPPPADPRCCHPTTG